MSAVDGPRALDALARDYAAGVTARELVTCSSCGRGYLRPLGVARAHQSCPQVELAQVRQRLALRRADLTLLAWWFARRRRSR